MKGNLTRTQVVEMFGEEAITRLEAINCEATNRHQCDGDDRVEFAAELVCADKRGEEWTVRAYYYQDADDAEVEDLSQLEWTIAGYEIC